MTILMMTTITKAKIITPSLHGDGFIIVLSNKKRTNQRLVPQFKSHKQTYLKDF